MLDQIKKLFGSGTKPAANDHLTEARECSIALLVEAALADGIYADVEHNAILQVIEHSFHLSGEAAEILLNKAEDRAEMAVDHYAFTRVIKQHLPKAERIALIGHLWDVTYADGEESPFEDALIRRVSALLAVTDHERAGAKAAAVSRSKGD